MSLAIPDIVADKVQGFPESSMGAHRVTLVLADGRRVADVTLAWAHEIVRIGDRDVAAAADLDFALDDVIDASPALDT